MVAWGIIGAGVISDTRFAPALTQARDSTLVAVHNRDQTKAEAFARKHGARRAYSRVEDLCQDPDVEAVYIASPNHLHAEHTILAVSHQKHVLCEKPMALDTAECERMIRAAAEAGVILGVAYMMPFHGSHQVMKRLLSENLLGDIALVQSDYLISLPYFQGPSFRLDQFRLTKELGGGAIMDLGVHCINTIRYLMGSAVRSVSSIHAPLHTQCDADTVAVITAQYENGALGVITLSFITEWGRNGIEFYGEKGALISEQSLSQVPEATVRSYLNGRWTEHSVEPLNPYVGEIEHFTQCIQTGETPIISGEQGLADMRVVEAAWASMQSGVRIEL
ncbi:MAG: Gfo/Idh/MocA family oxidoreductase [Ardenticatenaceae bacterium]|nr:Gfo/Idh/MocA family oxidoreductase [Ardenticatenaceae bacterium]